MIGGLYACKECSVVSLDRRADECPNCGFKGNTMPLANGESSRMRWFDRVEVADL